MQGFLVAATYAEHYDFHKAERLADALYECVRHYERAIYDGALNASKDVSPKAIIEKLNHEQFLLETFIIKSDGYELTHNKNGENPCINTFLVIAAYNDITDEVDSVKSTLIAQTEHAILQRFKDENPDFDIAKMKVLETEGRTRFIARVLLKGDKYGLNNCLVHEGDLPSIEFFDTDNMVGQGGSDKFQFPGQFVGARYFLDTFMEGNRDAGLCMDLGIPEWSLTGNESRECAEWIEANPEWVRLMEENKDDLDFSGSFEP